MERPSWSQPDWIMTDARPAGVATDINALEKLSAPRFMDFTADCRYVTAFPFSSFLGRYLPINTRIPSNAAKKDSNKTKCHFLPPALSYCLLHLSSANNNIIIQNCKNVQFDNLIPVIQYLNPVCEVRSCPDAFPRACLKKYSLPWLLFSTNYDRMRLRNNCVTRWQPPKLEKEGRWCIWVHTKY